MCKYKIPSLSKQRQGCRWPWPSPPRHCLPSSPLSLPKRNRGRETEEVKCDEAELLLRRGRIFRWGWTRRRPPPHWTPKLTPPTGRAALRWWRNRGSEVRRSGTATLSSSLLSPGLDSPAIASSPDSQADASHWPWCAALVEKQRKRNKDYGRTVLLLRRRRFFRRRCIPPTTSFAGAVLLRPHATSSSSRCAV